MHLRGILFNGSEKSGPYHDRQIAVLKPEDWSSWLYLTQPKADILGHLPAGSLVVETETSRDQRLL